MKKLLLLLSLCLVPLVAQAQLAPQAVIGYLASGQAGCPAGQNCFIQYGATIPVSGSITASNPSVSPTGAAVPGSATYIGINLGGNLVAPLGGPGTEAGALRVTLPTDGTGIVGAKPTAATTGGATPYHLAGGTAASTNATSIKGSAGTLYSISGISTSATLAYLRLYDSASAPTCTSATGAVHSYPIPASTTGAGFAIPIGAVGEAFSNGIGFCVTGGGTDTDSSNATTGIYINASYK